MSTYNPYHLQDRHRRAKQPRDGMSWAEGIKAMLMFYLILVAVIVATLAM